MPSSFQVALCFLAKDRDAIHISNRTSIIKQSISFIQVPGPARLSATIRAINSVPNIADANYNPVLLLKAVNHLWALGREGALAGLREYIRTAPTNLAQPRDPDNIDTGNVQSAVLIIRLLFEPKLEGGRIPYPRIGKMTPFPDRNDRRLWPLYPLAIQNDIPFMLAKGYGLFGAAEDPAFHLRWAEDQGKLRAMPLKPPDNPLKSVDLLIAMPQTARLFDSGGGVDGSLRRQGWRMIATALNQKIADADFEPREGYDPQEDWGNRKRLARRYAIYWDEKLQAYSIR
jgi:hypothetical protein